MQTVNLDKQYLRKFGLTTAAITAVLFGLFLPWLFSHDLPKWPWIIAGVLLIWALILPTTLKPIYQVWMKIGHVLGWINTRIILSILFYLLFMPIGFIMRLLGKDPLKRSLSRDKKSYKTMVDNKDNQHMDHPY